MNIYIYAKYTDDIGLFDEVIDKIKDTDDSIFVSTENRRSFREFNSIKDALDTNDIILIASVSSIGLNEVDILNQLEWFISKSRKLVICNHNSTYEYGVSQPMNKAILETIAQTIKQKSNIVEIPRSKKSNSGRSKISFPENWDELYKLWSNKEISSKDFIQKTGLKKATFYNLLTEYKEICEFNEVYIKKYKKV